MPHDMVTYKDHSMQISKIHFFHNCKKMNFRIAAAAFALLTASAQAAGSGYDYDQVDLWNLQFNNVGAGEFCGGAKQSPIALKSMDCTHYANYDFDVSNRSDATYVCLYIIKLTNLISSLLTLGWRLRLERL